MLKEWINTVDNTKVKYVSCSNLQRISSLKKANKVIAIAKQVITHMISNMILLWF